jgi:hypothetical protein
MCYYSRECFRGLQITAASDSIAHTTWICCAVKLSFHSAPAQVPAVTRKAGGEAEKAAGGRQVRAGEPGSQGSSDGG